MGFQRQTDEGYDEIYNRSIGRRSAAICAGLELVEVTSLRCLAYGGKEPPYLHLSRPSVVELTGQDNLGVRRAETRGWQRSCRGHLQGKPHWQLEESCPVPGGLSQSLCVCRAGRREDREQTSMESLKSTWRAVRFLSMSHGQKQEGPCLQFERA